MNQGPEFYHKGGYFENAWRQLADGAKYGDIRIFSNYDGVQHRANSWTYESAGDIGRNGCLTRKIPYELAKELSGICREIKNK